MPKVSLHHLSPDGARADSALGDQPLGELTAEQLGSLLGRFRALDAAQNDAHEPAITLQSTDGKFLVRTSAGKLHLYDARDSSQPAVEFDVPGLVAAFTGAPATRRAEEEPLVDLPAPKPFQQMLGTIILALGFGFNAWAIYAFFRTEAPDPVPVVEPLSDATDISRRRAQLAGTYATGTGRDAGDRLIVLGPADNVRLQALGPDHAVQGNTPSTGQLVRHEGRLCVALPGPAGLIEVLPDGRLLYSGDHYQRLSRK